MIDLSYISRVDAAAEAGEEAHAWIVVDPAGGDASRVFSDDQYHGTLPALLAAVELRDQLARGGSDLAWVAEGLERVARGGIRGWWVSLERAGVLDADLFEDDDYAGVRNSLRAALAWRAAHPAAWRSARQAAEPRRSRRRLGA